MALFRRKPEDTSEVEITENSVDLPSEDIVVPVVLPDGGPWDITMAPLDELPRLDLGALNVPIV